MKTSFDEAQHDRRSAVSAATNLAYSRASNLMPVFQDASRFVGSSAYFAGRRDSNPPASTDAAGDSAESGLPASQTTADGRSQAWWIDFALDYSPHLDYQHLLTLTAAQVKELMMVDESPKQEPPLSAPAASSKAHGRAASTLPAAKGSASAPVSPDAWGSGLVELRSMMPERSRASSSSRDSLRPADRRGSLGGRRGSMGERPATVANPNRPERVRKVQASQSIPALLNSAYPEAPPELPKRVLTAADRFDRTHRARNGRAEKLAQVLATDPTCRRAEEMLHLTIDEVRRTRYYVPEALSTTKRIVGRAKRVQAVAKVEWSLETSIWGPRKKWCDAKDFYDTDEIEHQKFTLMWQRACEEEGLQKFIVRHDDDAAADEDGDGIYDEVEETEAVLWDFHDVLFSVFDYYASTSGDSLDTITFNAFSHFIDECKICHKKHKFCKKADCDRVFIAIDAGPKGGGKQLNRVEFLAALVHIAVLRYVMPGEVKDVSNAMHALFSRDIEGRLDPSLFAETNGFRAQHCYLEGTDTVLRKHETSLRVLFAAATGEGSGIEAQLLSWQEWLGMMRTLRLIDEDLSDRDAKMCFVWSRMCVRDGTTARGIIKESNLPFEGFLEALCRLSALKALPTDEEIEAEGHPDAGSYLIAMRENRPEQFEQLLRTRAVPIGSVPSQPISRCVDHLISLIIRTIEDGTRGSDDLKLTADEVRLFLGADRKPRR